MNTPSPEWQRGFNAGITWAQNNFNVNTDGMPLPKEYVHRGGGWHNGFGEGLITGRSGILSNTFPNAKSISYANGKVVVKY